MAHLRILILVIVWQFSAFATVHAQNAKMLIAKGDSLLEEDRASKAMDQFNAALKLAPTADAYAAKARGWYYMGKYDKFMTDVNKALTLDSVHAQANYQRGLYALRTNDNTTAIIYSTRALNGKAPPDLRRKTLILRGEAEAAAGMTAQAIADIKEGLDGRTDDMVAMKTLARLHDAAGDPTSSLSVLESLCAMEPGDIGNWSNRGYELNQLGRYDEALQVLENALTIDKDEPVVLSNKAYALMKLDRDAEAFTNIDRSLRSDASNPYALSTRAQLYLRKGEADKACKDLTLAKAMGGAPEVDSLIKQHCAGMPEKH